MNEYEAYDILVNGITTIGNYFFGYFSIISAFLVMSYLVANKLTRVNSLILITLFTLSSLLMVLNIYTLSNDMQHLTSYMYEQKQSGVYDLAWFGKNPIWMSYVLMITEIMCIIGGYVGALLFFFYRSKAGD